MNDGEIGAGARGAGGCACCGSEAAAEEPEPSGREPGGPLDLDIIVEAGDWSAFADAEGAVRQAASALAAAPEAAGLAGREATVVLADDAMVRDLNKTYRHKDAPTNVLSFPFLAPPGMSPLQARALGDVILAAETLLREAAEMGISPKDHLQHLVIHGLLHLLGFDHIVEDEAQCMEAIETAVLAGLGIADPYAAH